MNEDIKVPDEIKIVGLSPKKTGNTNRKVISAIVGVIVLSVGVIAGILLVRQQQDLREKAEGNCDSPQTIVKCPAPDGNLYTCNPPDQNNNAQIQSCSLAGRVEMCGVGTNVKKYCCPAAGGAWTLDMTACDCDAKAPTGLITQNLASTSVTLKWTGATGGKLRLWVSKDPDPTGTCSTTSTTCVVNDLSITPITTTEHVLTNLAPNTKYYWRIMAWTKEGCDSGSAVMNFTTIAGGATSTPTTTATSTATTNPTRTATATATSKSTTTAKTTSTPIKSGSTTKATGSGTAFPVPETGADIPTTIGFGFGIILVLVSLVLAL